MRPLIVFTILCMAACANSAEEFSDPSPVQAPAPSPTQVDSPAPATSTLPIGTFFDACGCGCCGGEPQRIACFDNEADFVANRESIQAMQATPGDRICNTVGCSIGTRYQLCETAHPAKHLNAIP